MPFVRFFGKFMVRCFVYYIILPLVVTMLFIRPPVLSVKLRKSSAWSNTLAKKPKKKRISRLRSVVSHAFQSIIWCLCECTNELPFWRLGVSLAHLSSLTMHFSQISQLLKGPVELLKCRQITLNHSS